LGQVEVPTLIPGRIEYDEGKQKVLIAKIFETHFRRFLPESGQEPQESNSAAEPGWETRLARAAGIQSATACIAEVRAFLKSSDFSEEREWRLALLTPPETSPEEFRHSNGLLRPYREIPLGDPPPITRIIVGPGPHPEQAKDAIERYLRKLNLSHIPVEGSNTPVRL